MKKILYSMLLLAGIAAASPSWAADGCENSGASLCLTSGAEDLVRVPDTDWLIASGELRAINVKSRSIVPLALREQRFDRALYRDCPGPLPSLDGAGEQLHTHGINIRRGANGKHILYVVYHGARESVEIFEVDATAKEPSLAWVGCVVAPPNVQGNGVAVLPDGGFALTNFSRIPLRDLLSPRGVDARARYANGQPTGEVWEWMPAAGWKIVPGTEGSGLNGIEASPDGKWLYINEWSSRKVVKVSRGSPKVTRYETALDFGPDNIRWQSDGSLLAAGQNATTDAVFSCAVTHACDALAMSVVRVDPASMKTKKLVDHMPATPTLGMGTIALVAGDELWLSGLVGSQIIIRPALQTPPHDHHRGNAQ